MNRRHGLLAAGLAIAVWLVLFGDNAPYREIAEPVIRAAPSASALSHSRAHAEAAPVILALLPRESLFAGATTAKSKQRIFASQSWTPPPAPVPSPIPPPPVAPPLPFTYLGKKIEDGQWEVFLARGDQTLIVRAQSAIDGTYRVDAIKPPVLSLTYLPLNQVQTLPIGGTD